MLFPLGIIFNKNDVAKLFGDNNPLEEIVEIVKTGCYMFNQIQMKLVFFIYFNVILILILIHPVN